MAIINNWIKNEIIMDKRMLQIVCARKLKETSWTTSCCKTSRLYPQGNPVCNFTLKLYIRISLQQRQAHAVSTLTFEPNFRYTFRINAASQFRACGAPISHFKCLHIGAHLLPVGLLGGLRKATALNGCVRLYCTVFAAHISFAVDVKSIERICSRMVLIK